MLQADKQALQRDLAQQLVALQAKELNFLHANFLNLATTCAVLVGFGFTGLALFKDDDLTTNYSILQCIGWHSAFEHRQEPHLSMPPQRAECYRLMITETIDCFWAVGCAVGLGCNLQTLFIATITTITGPGMALRGPEGSLGVAIQYMERQHSIALKYFGRGISVFALSLIGFGAQACSHLGVFKGSLLIAVGIWAVLCLRQYSGEISRTFHFAVDRAVRGEFESHSSDHAQPPDHAQRISAMCSEAHVPAAASEPGCCSNCCSCCVNTASQEWSPLWRLDKMMVLPYNHLYIEQRLQGSSPLRKTPRTEVEAKKALREQVQELIHRAQGPVLYKNQPARSATALSTETSGAIEVVVDRCSTSLVERDTDVTRGVLKKLPDHRHLSDSSGAWLPFFRGRNTSRPGYHHSQTDSSGAVGLLPGTTRSDHLPHNHHNATSTATGRASAAIPSSSVAGSIITGNTNDESEMISARPDEGLTAGRSESQQNLA
mmetsp:Transcript_76497/g.127491  ORF Transcript_76497/g.127491 Transcript_76497/m.127491 type:complete len:490 (+) Transcript_76497:18-1487(+)